MKAPELKRSNRVVGGQTLIMAMIILGVMLILGMVFVGIVGRNITAASSSRSRSQAADLAEAGIRYAHAQLQNSLPGADWRGVPTPLNDLPGNFTRDPDALYLRQGSGYGMRDDADTQRDLGGPDGLGPYVRVNYSNGRFLVRVRYAPSDFNIFSTDPTGSLRQPGRARNYTIIESIGRPGTVNYADPTTLVSGDGIQFQGFADGAAFRQALGRMKDRDNQFVRSRKLIAFASIGIIESALYISNKDEVSTPADLGVTPELGASYNGVDVAPSMLIGHNYNVFDPANPPVAGGSVVPGGGGIYSNAPLLIHGHVQVALNRYLGDGITVADTVLGADDVNSMLSLTVSDFDAGWTQDVVDLQNLTTPSLDSRSPFFSTVNQTFRDGFAETDYEGFARGGSRKEPPSLMQTDSESGANRYMAMTASSGPVLANGVHIGYYGHGSGVYVNNTYDLQIRKDAEGRAEVGTEESLVYDWLNPGNSQERSGWKGPYYVPPGAFVQLDVDGFTITRDGSQRPAGSPDNQRSWRRPDGTDSGQSTLRYRIGDVGGVPYIINGLTPGANISSANPVYQNGMPFNGVVYFEGNVRIRGTIPTDRQLTIVSMGTIYIEGSITKGVVDTATGARLTRPSRSMLMLMAKDYVTVNTTQFFGPSFGQEFNEVDELAEGPNQLDLPYDWTALRVRAGDGRLEFLAEFPLDSENPDVTWANPASHRPFIEDYREYTGATDNGNPLDSSLMLTHTMDDGAAPFSFIKMDINPGLGNDSAYLFELTGTNAATPYFGAGYVTPGYTEPDYAPIYGLGVENWQRYSKFESTAFPIWDHADATVNVTANQIDVTNSPEGRFSLLLGGSNLFSVKTTSMGVGATNDWLMVRAAIVPHDIRIEASVYAEEGSFFVIPGNWFNPNTDDTRAAYMASAATVAERDAARLENYGASPTTPFYGEPIDVRVTIFGAVSENMPPPISRQAEWVRKWGWIPRELGSTGRSIPWSHVPDNMKDDEAFTYVPNLIITYDPVLATARTGGFDPTSPYVRFDDIGRPLPPLPRLPVSPTLSYFGEVNP